MARVQGVVMGVVLAMVVIGQAQARGQLLRHAHVVPVGEGGAWVLRPDLQWVLRVSAMRD